MDILFKKMDKMFKSLSKWNQWWYSCDIGVIIYLLDFLQKA